MKELTHELINNLYNSVEYLFIFQANDNMEWIEKQSDGMGRNKQMKAVLSKALFKLTPFGF